MAFLVRGLRSSSIRGLILAQTIRSMSAVRSTSSVLEKNGVLCLEVNNIQCKAYLLADKQSRKALLVDPEKGFIDRYLSVLAYYNLSLEAVLDTHTHADHVSGASDLYRLTSSRYAMSTNAPSPFVTKHLSHGDRITFGNFHVEVLETPGHTPDSLSFYCPQGEYVFTGDALLIGGTGRTDFAGGDPGSSYDSITKHLFTLPDNVTVLPAHDYRGYSSSSIGHEKRTNPRVSGKTREEYIHIMNNLGLPLPEKIMEALQVNVAAVDAKIGPSVPQYTALAQVRQMDAATLDSILRSPKARDVVVVDVREPFEVLGFETASLLTPSDQKNFEEGKVTGYASWPENLDTFDNTLAHRTQGYYIPVRQLGELHTRLKGEKFKNIVCVCRSGVRSTTAAAMLTALGFESVSNLKGGLIQWRAYQASKSQL